MRAAAKTAKEFWDDDLPRREARNDDKCRTIQETH